MGSGESILGMIHNVYGSQFLKAPEEYTVILTEIRVVFIKTPTKEPRTYPVVEPEFSLIFDELEGDALSHRSLEWIVNNMPGFYMTYEEIEDLNFLGAAHKGKLSFNCEGSRYSYDIPVEQYPMAERLEKLWKTMTELKECPECGGRLAGPLKYCRPCNKKYNEELIRLRKGFFTEPGVEISEGNKQTGLIMIGVGIFIIFMIVAVLVMAIGKAGLVMSLFCLPLPIFLIILGYLIYKGKRSGKLIIGIILMVFGAVAFVSVLSRMLDPDYRPYDPYSTSPLIGTLLIAIYGYYLVRRYWKN